MAIRGDLDVLDFVRETHASRVHGLYITEKPEPQRDNEPSAAVFNFHNLLQSQLIHLDVQDDVNIADDADDEAEEEDEEEAVNVDAEDDDEECLQFIDSDYEQTDEEQKRQKGAEDDRWFDMHAVEEAAEESQREPGEVPSDDYNSEDLLSVSEEEDEVDENLGVKKVSRGRKAPRFKQFKSDTDLFNPVFHIGMEFANMEQCREAIRFYAVSSARPLRWVKNDPHRVRVVCGSGGKAEKKGLGKRNA
ncbi:histone chaperone ASF1-like [Prunus avium]|uniref:Histone chaperone ASF1-like n=1 Tax=Prunus avium TaxID=42229 RepID=A0A6P5SID1_PRUAV|nr:histone chaperone ASF1-like [Prunus avium]